MATNDFKPFAIGSSANVTSQSDYEALTALVTGFQGGKASSAQINKAIRQSSVMAYVLAQFISDSASVDVLDNGTPASVLANLKTAMTNLTLGRYLNTQYIRASGTYTPTTGTKVAFVEAQGAGGGGGGASATTASTCSVSSGGNSGSYSALRILNPVATLCTVGQGGTGGVGNNTGSDGGATKFGSILSAPGGKGGRVVGSSSAPVVSAAPPATEIGSGGDVNLQSGQAAFGVVAIIASGWPGAGAPSPFGPGAGGAFQSSGTDAKNPGAGGSGAHSSAGTGAMNGGRGADGWIKIREYA